MAEPYPEPYREPTGARAVPDLAAAVGALNSRWEAVAAHRADMLRLVLRRGASREDAEDLVHDALLKVALYPRLDADRAAALLTTVVLRLAVDRHRQRERAGRLRRHRGLLPQPEAGPEELACDRAEAVWLAARLDELAERERGALLGRAAGRPTAEVAADLGTTAKGAESAAGRARRRLRETLVAASA